MKKLTLAGLGFAIVLGAGLYLYLRQVQDAPPAPIHLEPAVVMQGGQTRISESGLLPGEPVGVQIVDDGPAATPRPLRSAQAGVGGALTGLSVVLPDDLPSGQHRLETIGRVSGRKSTTTLWVRAPAPWLTVEGSDLKPHQQFGLVVGGFGAGERVSVTMRPAKGVAGGSATVITLPTDRVGNSRFTRPKVPVTATGTYTLVARGATSGQEVKRQLEIVPYRPTADLSPWSGPPGLRIELNARGFEAGEKVQIYLGAASTAAATVTADQYGNFWGAGKVAVPYTTRPGKLEVRAVGVDSGASVTRSFEVTKPKPWLQLSTWWGAPSAPVSLSGGGWAAGERITIHLGSAKGPAVLTGQADPYGWLHDTDTIYIPRDAASQVIFVAIGEESQSVATAKFQVVYPFGLAPEATVTPLPTGAGG